MSSSDPRDALKSMVHGLAGTFKRYDRSARKKAFGALTSSKGKRFMGELLNSPSRPITGVERLLSFKEWLYDETNSSHDP